MARNDGVDRTTVRNQPRTESNIADAEAHNGRQKACYRNEDIVPERSHLNIHFKEPSGSYQEMFRQMEQDGTISTRGLKQDAVHYGELVFDVNSAYFHNHGGYEYARAFYAEAYRAAVDIVGGEQYILSAVMHADERNQGMSKALGYDVWQLPPPRGLCARRRKADSVVEALQGPGAGRYRQGDHHAGQPQQEVAVPARAG